MRLLLVALFVIGTVPSNIHADELKASELTPGESLVLTSDTTLVMDVDLELNDISGLYKLTIVGDKTLTINNLDNVNCFGQSDQTYIAGIAVGELVVRSGVTLDVYGKTFGIATYYNENPGTTGNILIEKDVTVKAEANNDAIALRPFVKNTGDGLKYYSGSIDVYGNVTAKAAGAITCEGDVNIHSGAVLELTGESVGIGIGSYDFSQGNLNVSSGSSLSIEITDEGGQGLLVTNDINIGDSSSNEIELRIKGALEPIYCEGDVNISEQFELVKIDDVHIVRLKVINITLDPGRGSGAPMKVEVNYPGKYSLPEFPIDVFGEPKGYAFSKWDKGDVNTEITVSEGMTITAEYAKVFYQIVSGDKGDYIQNTANGYEFKVKRNINDDETIERFEGVYLDNQTNPVSDDHYDTDSGSLILTLKKEYLNSLSFGEHKIRIVFDDGEVTGTFSIVRANTPKTTYKAPKTGIE